MTIAALLVTPAMAGRFGGGGGRTYGGSTYTPRVSTPAPAPAAAPRFGGGGTYAYKPAQTTVVPRTSAPIVVNHNYGGGYGYGGHYGGGYGGGIANNPWFWMWAMGNHGQQQPVYVQGGQPMGGGYAPGYAPAPNPIGYIFAMVIQLILLALIVAAAVWIVRKVFFKK